MQKTIYLAGGCFWGLQKYLDLVEGVTQTEVGYANGTGPSPTYEDVCAGSGHAETVLVTYEADAISLTQLPDVYSQAIDPTSVNRQGGDSGVQYRTGVYFTDNQDGPIISGWLTLLGESLTKPVAIELKPLQNYTRAEEYHQDYLAKNPGGYCHLSESQFQCAANANHRVGDTSLRDRLTPMQYEVTVCSATEPPFENEYFDNYREGIYVDIISGKPLFVSTDKFESGCGWPAFSKPIDDSLVDEFEDLGYGRVRTEVRASGSNAHLGHVFDDGPAELGGLRYCINRAALRFVAKDNMEAEGYGEYLPLIK